MSRTLFRLVVVTRRFVYTVRTTAVELFRAGNRCWPIQKWQREREREEEEGFASSDVSRNNGFWSTLEFFISLLGSGPAFPGMY